MIVHASHDVEEWNDEARKSASHANHSRSIRVLKQAKAQGHIVRFGTIGRGFSAIEDSPQCEVASRALIYVVQSDGATVVYSLFREP